MSITHVPHRYAPPPRNRAERRAKAKVSTSNLHGFIFNGIPGFIDVETGAFVPKLAGGQSQPAPAAAPQVIGALPFTSAAHEYTEPAFNFTVTPGAAVTRPNPQEVPAFGYVSHVLLEVTAAGGVGGTIAADGPWSAIESAQFRDVNGSPIVNPLTGYQLYLANVFGGYAFNNDPALAPDHVGSAPNPKFFIRIPIEIAHRDAIGALLNQNAAAKYKLDLAINTLAAIFSAAPTTAPAVTVRAWLEAWTLPADRDARQRPQAQVPPMLGTAQYWSARDHTVPGAGSMPVLSVTRLGNYIRSIVLVGRDGTGARSNAPLPDPLRFTWDGNQMENTSLAALRMQGREKIGGQFTWPTGVVVLPFNHLITGRMGNDLPDLWLATSESSRIDIEGNSVGAGKIEMLVNEVAPVEVNQAERYQFPSDTGARAA